jgi:cytochrome bd ubiquinol oxidase subunit I
MDVLFLSRWQFAITTIYHFLFVPITLGLSMFVALLETCYVTTRHEAWKKQCLQLVKFFGTIFLINFAMGVVTGIVQEFHFGMNWSEYSRFMGDIFGAPLALEALTAFFLESTFLAVWAFGWDKLSPKLHCICIWIVAFASNLSAFWILVANSFMQHPVGYILQNGRAEMTDFAALLTNPYVIGQYSHTFFSGIVTAGFLVLGICAYKIWKKSATEAFVQCLKGATLYTLIGLFAVMVSGHLDAQYIHEAQPMKLSSMEALWETADPAPFAIMANIDTEKHENTFELSIPNAFSFMLYNKPTGAVIGINELQKLAVQQYGPGDYTPDVTGLFWSFRIMLAAGGAMLLIVLSTAFLLWKKQIERFPLFLKFLVLTLPIPFIANSVGWYIAEAGRQPWIVVGLQKTAAAFSPNLTPTEVFISLIGFTLIYLALAVAALYVVIRFIRRAPETLPDRRDA